jgi:2-polyprenyl-6-methoxyphenol hydroxylase-like FAD-dependent oxidoreductase
MRRRDPHAAVIGGSMAGLAVATALTERFDQVTVIDRDRLPDDVAPRKGVPQDRHLHLLLPAGATAWEDLSPGVLADMADAGAVTGDADRIRMCLSGHRLAPARIGESVIFASRPLVEAQVRRRVRHNPAITIDDGRTASGLMTDSARSRVTGLQLSGRGDREEELPAELVVDCSGRATRTPRWLADLGYEPPRVEELQVEVRYVTRIFSLPSDALDGDRHVLVGPTAGEPRGGAMTHIGPDEWMVTLFGMGGEVPPQDLAGFQRFADRLPIPDIADSVREGAAISEPHAYRFRANVRHRYEDLADFPDGLLVTGDAVCSFNPIYGQGMSVAALEARRLRDLLRGGSVPRARDWFGTIAPTVDDAWQLAIGADLAVDAIDGERPWLLRMLNRYVRALHAAGVDDPVLAARFARVAGLLDRPRSLLHPAAVTRVLGGMLRPSG